MQQRQEQRAYVGRNQLGAFCGGVNSILLDRIRNRVHVGVQHGQQRSMIFGRDLRENGVELADVVRTVIGRQRDAEQQNLASCPAQGSNNRVQVVARRCERQPAQSVIASQLDDDDCRMQFNDVVQPIDRIFCSIPADALIDHAVAVSASVQISLQVVWIAMARLNSIARRDAVSKTDDLGGWTLLRGMAEETASRERKNKERQMTAIHGFSVATGKETE
jgi:hypothetical protein